MKHPFRPFGPLQWTLGNLKQVKKWSLIGTVSPEDRCLSVLSQLDDDNKLEKAEFIRIDPSQRKGNPKFRERFTKKLNSKQKAAMKIADKKLSVHQAEILCSEGELIQLFTEAVTACTENLIIDISAMPKRFFIPLVTRAVEMRKLKNLVVTYTTPEKHGQSLAEDPQPWNSLPMFGAASSRDVKDVKLIVAVGYLPLRLSEKVDGHKFNASNVELLLPFPSIHPGFRKNWEFVAHIKQQIPNLRSSSIKRVSTNNMPLAFEKIVGITDFRNTQCVLAPFGPKPISLAMCLYGIACRNNDLPIEIGYTQPQVYADDYSSGIAMKDQLPDTTAYCVMMNGKNLYTLNRQNIL